MSNIDRAISALFHLDPGCDRDTWVAIQMAAKAAGIPFEVVHEWCTGGSNYKDEQDCRVVWDSIKPGPVTEDTLFWLAKKHGWRDPAGQHAPDALSIRPEEAGSQVRTNNADFELSKPKLKAQEVWDRCQPATAEHGYIVRKQGLSDGLGVYPDDAPSLDIHGQDVAGCLVVPCVDLDGVLQTLQFIPPGKGKKLNLPDASFSNGCFVVGVIERSRQVFVVEGVGQAWACHQATGAAAVACMGAGRLRRIAVEVRRKYPHAQIVVVADKGKENKAMEAALPVGAAVCRLPEGKPNNYDVNDFLQEHGREALTELLSRSGNPVVPNARFRLITASDLQRAPAMRWTVKGLLPWEGTAGLYGPSRSGKSFLCLSLAAAVAAGDYEWFGRRVSQCPVTYCALEGEVGFAQRLQAWSRYHGCPAPDALRFVTQPFNLLKDGDVKDLADAVRQAGGAGGMVILDTLNRAAPGADENSSSDMGRVIAAVKRLQEELGGLVLLVHHTGKDASRGMRGHSSLFAALDAAIEVSRDGESRIWRIDKAKDGRDGDTYPFRLEEVMVGLDDEGEVITSCVAVGDQSAKTIRQAKVPQGDNQKRVYDALQPLFKEGVTGKAGAPPERPCIELKVAVNAGAAILTCSKDKRTHSAKVAITGMVKRDVLGLNDGWLWLP